MLGILTSNFVAMRDFYREVMGFEVILEMEEYVEYKNEGVRLAISTHKVMHEVTAHPSFKDPAQGHHFELAFRSNSPAEVDTDYEALIAKGAEAIKAPADMPWGQRAAFFADPDGNIHEIFADLNPSQ